MWTALNDITIAGNELWRLALFSVIMLLSLIVGRLARIVMRQRSERVSAEREWVGVTLGALSHPVVLIAFSIGFKLCNEAGILLLPESAQWFFDMAARVLLSISIGFACLNLTALIDHALLRVASGTETRVDDMLVPLVGKSIRITILVLVVAQVVQSISDKPLTTLLAGLGVGGLAVALAGQDTVKNFFGSVVILADKPFEIGDRVVIGSNDGSVESVGFRSTKLRTLDGHLVTIPNSEMVNTSVRNISKRPYIKRTANIAVTYDTPPERLQHAVQIIKEILAQHEGMDAAFPPRVHFSDFNDSSLNILVIYWYHTGDYWASLKFSEWVNMEILRRFNEAGIEFAFPTRTLHVAGGSENPLPIVPSHPSLSGGERSDS